ncbi:hypothetical protein [Rubellicoccus peritrichatus]|uniref:Beta-agarase n=1 Tax=Rubellicoccus peritrichatus TaxID=3080537 RepID=A0AAQ3L908_9BACT|nr:hypothetical protein [Puniceicoccus sp. CR14]WOO40857.1 hypothetical protein RZN69_19715 [Puniceicoccus sp. CR14]
MHTYISALAFAGACAGATLAQGTPATVDIYLDIVHSVEGIETFDRTKFINMHSSQSEGEWDSPEMMEQFLNGWDVYLGREVGTPRVYVDQVKEDPNRPGYPSIEHLEELGYEHRSKYSKKKDIHAYEERNDLIASTHIHPYYPDGTKTNMGWAFANADATGTYLAHYFRNFFGDADGVHGEPAPIYFEVINEPVYELIIAPGDKAKTNQEEIFEYHNIVADKVRDLNPDILIGGFTQASPDHEYDNFDQWHDNWELFMDKSGDRMDFFSIHLYDKGWDRGNQYLRKGSNVEAILDMIEHASHDKLGVAKPFLISEYGAYDAAYAEDPFTPERDWINLKAFSSMMLNFMDRPNLILKSVPFMIMKANWWNHESGQPYAYRLLREEDGEWVYTELAKFYEFWTDVNGTRVRTHSSDPDIQSDAYVQGNTVYLILNNLEFESRRVALNFIDADKAKVNSVTVKQLHAPDGKPALDVDMLNALPSEVEISAEAAMIVECEFDRPLNMSQRLDQKKYYADKYLQPINEAPLDFQFSDIEIGHAGEATLRIGLGREHNLSLQPEIEVNGKRLEQASSDVSGDDQLRRKTFFGVIEVPVPYNFLKEDNTVTLSFPDQSGHVSSLALEVLNLNSNQ